MLIASLGILVNLCGSLSTAMGWALQKRTHNEIKGTNQHYLSKWMWWVGMVLVLMSQPLYITAVSMTKQSVLGVVAPFSIIFNIILARFFLGESIKLLEYFAMVLLIPGAILTLSFAKLENHRYNRREFNELFYSNRSVLYLMCSFIAMFVMLCLSQIILSVNSPTPNTQYISQVDDTEVNMGTSTTLDDRGDDTYRTNQNIAQICKINTLRADCTCCIADSDPMGIVSLASTNKNLVQFLFENSRLKFIPLLTYPYFGPFLSSLTCTFVRCIGGFATSDPDPYDEGNFYGVMPMFYLVCIPFFGFCAYLIVNKALQHYNTIYVVPLFRVGDLLHNNLSGAIFLKEFGDYTPIDLTYFMCGVMICISAVLLLLMCNDKNEQQSDEKQLTPSRTVEKLASISNPKTVNRS